LPSSALLRELVNGVGGAGRCDLGQLGQRLPQLLGQGGDLAEGHGRRILPAVLVLLAAAYLANGDLDRAGEPVAQRLQGLLL
jgi:hypothetical protein